MADQLATPKLTKRGVAAGSDSSALPDFEHISVPEEYDGAQRCYWRRRTALWSHPRVCVSKHVVFVPPAHAVRVPSGPELVFPLTLSSVVDLIDAFKQDKVLHYKCVACGAQCRAVVS